MNCEDRAADALRVTFHARALRGALALLAAAAALLGACGGGDGGGVGSGGTGGYAAGPITGFGSVIVNGVRFDDSTAAVEDADGAGRSRDDLRLGMTVEIDSGAITATTTSGVVNATATASRIRVESELVGPVGLVDASAGSFTMLGQRVTVDANTVFDESLTNELGSLNTGRMVEVYAVFDPATLGYLATRVDPAAGNAAPRLRGPVAQVDTVAQALRIGSATYGYAGATDLPAGLAAGQIVRLRLTLATSPLRWVVQSFGTAMREIPEGDGFKLMGLVSTYASIASFSVNGRPVDASAASFPDGTALAVGVRVEVEGTVRNGVLRASKVTIRSESSQHDRGFELTGNVTSVDALDRTFVLRGQTISTARPGLRYEGGTAADLVAGRRVEVTGQLSPDRRRVEATRIKFE